MHFDPTWLQVFASATTALASIPLILEALRNRKNQNTQENPGKHWDDKTDSPGDSKDGNPQDVEGGSEEATDTPEDSKEQAPESMPDEEAQSGESDGATDGETDLDEATDSTEEADRSDEAGQDTEEAQESAEGSEGSSSDGEGTDSGTDSNTGSASQEADSDAEATDPGSEATNSTEGAQGGSGGTQGDLKGTPAELEELANAQSFDNQEADTGALDGELVRQGETQEPPVSEPVYDTALTLAALAVEEEARQEEKERNARGAVEEGKHITAYVPVVTAESQPGTGAGSNQGRWNPPGLRFYNSEWMQKIERILTHKMGIVKETKSVKKTYQRWNNKSNRPGGIIYPKRATLTNRDTTMATYVGVDTSQSMYAYNPNRVAEALDEILQKNLLDVRVACIDTVMRDWQETAAVKDILMEGGGGTLMSPFFEAVNVIAEGYTDMPKPNLVILLTDGELYWSDWLQVAEESGKLAGRNIPVFILILDKSASYPDHLADVAHVYYV
jgi:hypothetical protein